jgi:hypothetical protein
MRYPRCGPRFTKCRQRIGSNNHSELSVQWNTKLWRADILQLRLAAAVAWQDAMDAHLIVFALNPSASLPAWLVDWLEQWAAHRQIPDVALAVASQKNGETLSAATNPELSRFADRHGLSFIFDEPPPRKNNPALFTNKLPEAKPPISAFLPRLAGEKLSAGDRGWGINE